MEMPVSAFKVTLLWLLFSFLLAYPEAFFEEGFKAWPVSGSDQYALLGSCEEERSERFLRRPGSSVASLFFLWIVILLSLCLIEDIQLKPAQHHNLILSHPIFSFIFLLCSITYTIGNFFKFASSSRYWQWVEASGAYSVLLFVNVYTLTRLLLQFQWFRHSKHPFRLNTMFFLQVAGSFGLSFVAEQASKDSSLEQAKVMISLIMLVSFIVLYGIYWSVCKSRRSSTLNLSPLIYSLIIYVVANLVDMVDKTGDFCNPISFFQLKYVSSLAYTLSAYFMYQEMRTERVMLKTWIRKKERVDHEE